MKCYGTVSSPQGNATNWLTLFMRKTWQSVSSPQGNATNFTFRKRCWHLETCFKSPRECYKHPGVSLGVYYVSSFQVPKGMLQTGNEPNHGTRKKDLFQVPKGMLQTTLSPGGTITWGLVSSPQGNATNFVRDKIFTRYKTFCFKSPRECYKLLHNLNLKNCWTKVSSPQGNATNVDTFYVNIDFIYLFQVPKGMLQTWTMTQSIRDYY